MTNLVQFPGLGLSFDAEPCGLYHWRHRYLLVRRLHRLWPAASRWCLRSAAARSSASTPTRWWMSSSSAWCWASLSARLYYVAMAPYNYDTIWDVLAVRDGGLAIYGGIIGAFVFGGLACKWRGRAGAAHVRPGRHGLPHRTGLRPLGQLLQSGGFRLQHHPALGHVQRSNGRLPDGQHRHGAQGRHHRPRTMPVHPTFLYESIWCFVGLALLVAYIKKRKFNGRHRPALPRLVRRRPVLDRSSPHRQPAAGAVASACALPSWWRLRPSWAVWRWRFS